MPIVLFTARILNGARANLRAASHVRDAAVDIGGYHFECGVRDFEIWSRIVSNELRGSLDLADVYFRMRERAFELAKEVTKAGNVNPAAVSDSLSAFMKISKPTTPSAKVPPSSAKPPASIAGKATTALDLSKVEKWQFVLWYRRANNRLDESLGRERRFPEHIPEGTRGVFAHDGERSQFLAWYKTQRDFYDKKFGSGSTDKLLSVIIAEESKEGGASASRPGTGKAADKPTAAASVSVPHVGREEASLERLLGELRSHIGLAGVKKDIEELANSINVDHMRRTQGLKVADRSLHMVFYGNPGTGKTTVARLVARIYKELGVLTKGHLVCTDRAGLVARYVGQTAPKVTAVVQEALGGVLFIDEAYSLAPPDPQNDFGQEAIQQLLLLMENHRKELVVIVAGYPDEMARFLDANPGLNSRFTKKLHFEDYTPEQLVQIFEKMCGESDYRLHERARAKLLRSVQAAYSQRGRTFGNARFARNLFEEATKNLANRIVASNLWDGSALMLITEDDIPDHAVSPGPANPTRLFPDLGKHLASKGWPQKSALIYPSWEIGDLAIMGGGHYCTTRVQPLEGNLYCATFDFGDDILEQILTRAPAATVALVRRSLAEDTASVRRFEFPEAVNVGIVATFGTLQEGLHDTFIPLVITDVFGADASATMDALAVDLSLGSLSENGIENTASLRDGPKQYSGTRQDVHSSRVNPEITTTDVKAIRALCRHLAREWWKAEPRQVAICDACNSPVLRDEGFLMGSSLCCETCFGPNSTPDIALKNLLDDPDHYGEGLLDEARRFAGMRPRK